MAPVGSEQTWALPKREEAVVGATTAAFVSFVGCGVGVEELVAAIGAMVAAETVGLAGTTNDVAGGC